ncbi:MAG: DNA methyltransferase [Dehalococcoidia bacterium]|nr:DNA methyltransferase [Dehalococcoidia bacterium]
MDTNPSAALTTGVLYYGDNLDVLRKYIPDESVDLVYLDPPFNSNRSYNILFKESGGAGSEAQIEAFEDTWHWGQHAQAAYEEMLTGPHQNVARMLKAMVDGLGHNDVTAYLTMMAIRLVELRRVLKPTGSLYLHCDPTAGHYLKMLMDGVFGPANFRSEISWKRTSAHSSAKRYGPVHDLIFYYTKSDSYTWNPQMLPYAPAYVDTFFDQRDQDGRRWKRMDLTGAGIRHGETGQAWRGIDVTAKGRHWAYPPTILDELDAAGRVHWPKGRNGMPRLKQYEEDMPGVSLQDVWTDIRPIHNLAVERLGYPTQKPLALLERIVAASSNEGDIVLDPFCGCGTAVHAAQKLGRRWIGIDITHLAIGLIRRRMEDAFPGLEITVIGEPVDLAGARELAARDKYQFQWWALDRLGAQPVSGKKKGSDKGIDGVIPFFESPQTDFKRALVSVKGGEHVTSQMLRDLRGVIERENEPLGVFVTLVPPTRDMTAEAAAAGHYHNDLWQKDYPRIQILTIEDILNGKRPQMPPQRSPFAKAPLEREAAKTERLL